MYRQCDNVDAKLIRMSSQNTIKNQDSLILVYVSKLEDKLSLLITVSKNITQEYNAGNIVKKLAIFVNGSGGGQARHGCTDTLGKRAIVICGNSIAK